MISSVRLRTCARIFSHEGLSQGRPAVEDADSAQPVSHNGPFIDCKEQSMEA